MRFHVLRSVLVVSMLGVSLGVAGCTANVDDVNVTVDDPVVSFDTNVDVENIEQGQTVPMTVEVDKVYLIEPNETPPPDKADAAGHLVFYFDDFDHELLVTAKTSVEIKIPDDAEEGDHKVLCRVHKHDNTPTEAVFEMEIKVKAKVSVDSN